MKYFPNNIKPTVGSHLHEATEPIVSDKERVIAQLDNHRNMQKDKLGQTFSPLTRSDEKGLALITKNKNNGIS